jgi:hypothetical protein
MPKKGATLKKATSFHLSPEAKSLLTLLGKQHGLSRAAVVEMLIRKEARRMKIEAEDGGAA